MDANAIVIVDNQGVICHWNACAEAWFGHAAAAALGQSLDLIVPPDFRADHWRGFRRAVASGFADVDGRSTAFPVRRADGSTLPFQGAVTLLRNADKRVIGAMTIFEPSAA